MEFSPWCDNFSLVMEHESASVHYNETEGWESEGPPACGLVSCDSPPMNPSAPNHDVTSALISFPFYCFLMQRVHSLGLSISFSYSIFPCLVAGKVWCDELVALSWPISYDSPLLPLSAVELMALTQQLRTGRNNLLDIKNNSML